MQTKGFKGLNEDQFRRISSSLGYNGPIEGFNEFLSSQPEAATRFSNIVRSLQKYAPPMAASEQPANAPQSYAKGGLTTKKEPEAGYVAYPVQAGGASGRVKQEINKARNRPQNIAGGKTQAKAAKISPRANQFISQKKGKIAGTGAQITDTALPDFIDQKQAPTYDATTVSDKVEQAGQDLQAAQGLPSAQATVQGQLADLYQDFEGDQPPAWASGAMRAAEQRMAARGLGASTMAGEAVTQAAMESALPIAQQDAATYAQFEQANLNREQEVRLNRFNSRLQGYFTDQAAQNAAKQFNAANETEMAKFYDSLNSSIDIARSNITNDVNKFNANMKNARQQFNATNSLAIASANKAWRQRIATENNAAKNAVNQLNASLLTGMQQNAFDAYVQMERDTMSYINEAINRTFVENENAKDRLTDIALSQMQADLSKNLQSDQQEFAIWQSVGRATQAVLTSDLGQDFLRDMLGL